MQNQVFNLTKDTTHIAKKVQEYIKRNKLPLEKKIGKNYFSALLKETPKNLQDFYLQHGIPFRQDDITYTLRAK